MVAHSATLEINERVAAHRRAGRSILHLGFGEAGLPVLPELVEALTGAAPQNTYAPVAGSEPVRAAAAGYWRRRGSTYAETDADQIVMAPGSKPLLFAVLAVIDGDVVLPEPSWVSYAAQAALTGKRVVSVPIPPEAGGVPDPDRLEDALRAARADGADPRILLLTLPDNPTGTVAGDAMVQAVCEVAEKHGLVILSDEIYRDLTHDGNAFAGPAAFLPERTIVTGGLSKNLALGGWRIGFARVPASDEGRAWRSALLGVASEVWSSMSTPMEAAATYALGEPDAVTAQVARSRRLHARVAVAAHDVFTAAGAEARRPTAGFYSYPDLESQRPALARAGVRTGMDLGRYLLDEHGLAVLPGEAFGDDPAALRFRAATSLLYGDTDQRLQALHADDPASLPWISAALQRLADTLASLSEPALGTGVQR